MITVYILYSEKLKKYYTGQTQDLSNRLNEHNAGETQFMASGKPWNLIWSIEVSNRSEAVRLEKQIKQRGAKRFLENINPLRSYIPLKAGGSQVLPLCCGTVLPTKATTQVVALLFLVKKRKMITV